MPPTQVEGMRYARQKDHRPPSAQVQGRSPNAQSGRCCREGGHQRAQRPPNRPFGVAALTAPSTSVAHSTRSACGGLGTRTLAAAAGKAESQRCDAARGTAAPSPGGIRPRCASYAPTPPTPVARGTRPRTRSILRPGTSAGSARPFGFHRRRWTRRYDRRRTVRASALSVCACVFGMAIELRRRRRRELSGDLDRVAIGTMAVGRSARGKPNR